MPIIRSKLEPGDVDQFLEELENFQHDRQHNSISSSTDFGRRLIPMFLESKAKRPRKPVKCLCNILDKDETNPELLARSERCRELAKQFKALGDIRGCVTAYPTLSSKGSAGGGGVMSEIKRRKSQRWCHYLLPPQRSSTDNGGDNDDDNAPSLPRADLLTFDNRVRVRPRKGRAKKYNTKGRLKDPPPAPSGGGTNGRTEGNDNGNDDNEKNQDSTNQGNDEKENEATTAAEGDDAPAAAEPAALIVNNSQQDDTPMSVETGEDPARQAVPQQPNGIKRRLVFVAWHHFHPLLIQLLCRDDNKRLYNCPDTVPAWLIQRFEDVENTYSDKADWSAPNEAFFVPSYPTDRAHQDYRATVYQCQLQATIDSALAQRWDTFAEQRSGIAAAPDNAKDGDDDDDEDHCEDLSDEEHAESRRNGDRARSRLLDYEGNGGMYMYSDDVNPHYYDPYSEPPLSPHQQQQHGHPCYHQEQQPTSPIPAPWNRSSPLHRTALLATAASAQPRSGARAGSPPAATKDGAAATVPGNRKSDDVSRGRRLGIVASEESSWQEAATRLFEERNRLQECVCLLMERACHEAQLDDERAGSDVRRLEGVVEALQKDKKERDKRKEKEMQKEREAEAAAAKAATNARKAKLKRERRRNRREAETKDGVSETLGDDAAEPESTETSKKRKASTPKRNVPQLHKRGKVPATTAEYAAAVRASVELEVSSEVGGVVAGPASESTPLPSTGHRPDVAAALDEEAEVVDLTASPPNPPPTSPLLNRAS